MKRLRIILQSRYFFKINAFIFLIIGIMVIFYYPFRSKYCGDEKVLVGKVVSYVIDGDKLSITLLARERVIVYYYFKSQKEKEYYQKNLFLGDIVSVYGELVSPSQNRVFGGFNYKKYLYYHSIYYLFNSYQIKKIENNTSFFYMIKNNIVKRLYQIDDTGYLQIFLLGDKGGVSDDMMDVYRENGISHLFSISGMHISFIVTILFYFFDRLTYQRGYQYVIVSAILVFYVFLADFSASIVRAVIMFILSAINKCFHLKISSIDIVLFTLIVVCVFKPLLLCDMGFQFSYLISFFLVLSSKRVSGNFMRLLYSSYVCFLASIPLCLYYFYQINLLSFFLNLVMIPFVSLVVFPFSIIIFFVPFFSFIYSKVIYLLEGINYIIYHIKIFIIHFSCPSFLYIIIFYFFVFLCIKKSKFYLIFIIFLLILLKVLPLCNSSFFEVNIDVGQGDSSLIVLPHGSGNILIDTGGVSYKVVDDWRVKTREYSIVIDKTIPFFYSFGITKINYLIFTHGDFDHMGEAINLVNNFKVEKVIFNCGPYNDLEKELIKVLDKKKIKYYSCIKELSIDNSKLYFLQTDIYDNENDNSNVIYTELDGYKFMFMGDASTATEKEILDKYNLPEIDVLKVGHHGSRTSSSKDFINEIEPKHSIISVGKNNRYGHPNKEVLDNLKDSKIYRTDKDGSIMFKIKNNKLKIETCSP